MIEISVLPSLKNELCPSLIFGSSKSPNEPQVFTELPFFLRSDPPFCPHVASFLKSPPSPAFRQVEASLNIFQIFFLSPPGIEGFPPCAFCSALILHLKPCPGEWFLGRIPYMLPFPSSFAFATVWPHNDKLVSHVFVSVSLYLFPSELHSIAAHASLWTVFALPYDFG